MRQQLKFQMKISQGLTWNPAQHATPGTIVSRALNGNVILRQFLIKTKAAYDHAVDALQKLLDKRDSQRKDELCYAVIHSSKSYDEILQMIADLSTEEK